MNLSIRVATPDKNKTFDHVVISVIYKTSCANAQCQSSSYSLFLGIHNMHLHNIRGHSSDVYLGMSLIQNGGSYLMY